MSQPKPKAKGISRRGMLKRVTATGAGLVIGMYVRLDKGRFARAADAPGLPKGNTTPNAFLQIAPDNTVTILSKHIEFGQGTYTGIATLIAEELDADWSQMRAAAAPAGAAYNNLFFGPMQGTGGSTAIANSFIQMRTVGANARAMLVAAAAAAWDVPAGEITVAKGTLSHPSGKSSGFGAFAEAAMKLPPPKDVTLKDPKDFVLIGTQLPKLDTPAKLRGTATYTIDIDRPNILTVVVARPPRFGATVKAFDDGAAKGVPGYVGAASLGHGVAVYAQGYWAAKQASHKLKVTWDESKAEKRSTADIIAGFKKKLDASGTSAAKVGDADARLAKPTAGDKVISADFEFPYLAHAPMETLDCVLEYTADGGAEAWYGAQFPTADHMTIAKVLGIPPQKMTLNVVFGGGSFGRRATADAFLAKEAALALKSSPDKRPIKLIWTREDDIRGGYYRPIYVHRVEAVVAADKTLAAWRQRIVGQSIAAGTPFEPPEGKPDETSVEGARNQPYAIPNFSVELHSQTLGVPVLWWRSVGSTHTAFSVETMIDEVGAAMGLDAVAVRLQLLGDKHPRHTGVLQAAAKAAGWGRKPAKGRAFGVALHESFRSYVAQIAEVSLKPDGMPQVHKVWCAVDCGLAINPDIVKAQMEGGLGYGLGAALYNAIDLVDGRVVQRNFDDYLPLRMADMPDVEVIIVPSAAPPTGVGEPGTPPIAPAVANALFHLTGKRVRTLPFSRGLEVTS